MIPALIPPFLTRFPSTRILLGLYAITRCYRVQTILNEPFERFEQDDEPDEQREMRRDARLIRLGLVNLSYGKESQLLHQEASCPRVPNASFEGCKQKPKLRNGQYLQHME